VALPLSVPEAFALMKSHVEDGVEVFVFLISNAGECRRSGLFTSDEAATELERLGVPPTDHEQWFSHARRTWALGL
jgi:hypothetical protein